MIEIYNNDCQKVLYKILEKYKNKNIVMVSDPPFNMGYHYNTYDDNKEEDEYYLWLSEIFTTRTPFVIIHYPESLYKLSYQCGIFPNKIISWVYNSNTTRQHRDIAFFGINPIMTQVKQPYKNLNDKRIKERIKQGCGGGKLYDWWEVNQVKNVEKEKNNNTHPCVMPLQVMENIIGILPQENLLVIDPFMGSGTTGVACKNLNVDFVGIEIDKEYYNIAKKRLNEINLFNYETIIKEEK